MGKSVCSKKVVFAVKEIQLKVLRKINEMESWLIM